jgi:hypothetical protein
VHNHSIFQPSTLVLASWPQIHFSEPLTIMWSKLWSIDIITPTGAISQMVHTDHRGHRPNTWVTLTKNRVIVSLIPDECVSTQGLSTCIINLPSHINYIPLCIIDIPQCAIAIPLAVPAEVYHINLTSTRIVQGQCVMVARPSKSHRQESFKRTLQYLHFSTILYIYYVFSTY